jgi:hypothetical protein
MTAQLSFNNLDAVKRSLSVYSRDIQTKGFWIAVKAGTKVLLRAYRKAVGKEVKPGRATFLTMYEAIDSKEKELDTGAGVYGVVGTFRKGGKRVAPQGLWLETGTKERWTRGKGPVLFVKSYRGIMFSQNSSSKGPLEKARASLPDAQNAMLKALENYVRTRS